MATDRDSHEDEESTSLSDRDIDHIYVVCGEAGEPQRAYEDRDDAEALVEHWRSGDVKIRGSIRTIDLVGADNAE